MNTKQIDFSELQDEVLEYFEDLCIETSDIECVSSDPQPFFESTIRYAVADKLHNPVSCVMILGFDSLASYIAQKRLEENAN